MLNAITFSFVKKEGKLFAVLNCNYFWNAVWQLFNSTRHSTCGMDRL